MVRVERLRTGVEGFDPLVAGGIPRGFFVAVVGEPGTGKTVFSIHFAYQGVREGDKVIYVTTEESRESVLKQAAMFGMDLGRAVDEGRAIVIDALLKSRSDEWSLEDVSVESLVNKVLEAKRALGYGRARLVVDSMSAFWLDKPAMARKYSYMVKRVLYRWDFTTLLVSQYAITTQSLPPWEPIVVRRGDEVRVTSIGEFVDSFLEGEGGLDIGGLGYYTLSLDTRTLKPVWRRIRGVIKHRIRGRLLRVKASKGRSIDLTGSHSIYRISRGGGLEVVGSSDLRPGDSLVTPASVELPESAPSSINAARELWSRGVEGIFVVGLPGEAAGYRGVERSRGYDGGHAIPLETLVERYGDSVWSLVSGAKLAVSRGAAGDHPVPATIPLDTGFYLLLGFIVSAGSVDVEGGHVTVTLGPGREGYVGDVVEAVNSTAPGAGVRISSGARGMEVTIRSRVLSELLARVFGAGPGPNRDIPSIVFRAPKPMKRVFLKGLYAGGGVFDRSSGSLIYATDSRSLLNGLALLLLNVGAGGYRIDSGDSGRALALIVENAGRLDAIGEVLEHLGFHGGREAVQGVGALERATAGLAGQATVAVQRPATRGGPGVDVAGVTGLEHLEASTEFVYDLSVEGDENFFAGLGWILVHNSAFGWGLEHVADGIIRFRRRIVGGALRRYVVVEKMRQTPHDLRVHRVEIEDGRGMRIAGPLEARPEDLRMPEDLRRRLKGGGP